MSLPPPNGNTFWKNYEIKTPTFQLSPVEKPDMSPFLIHMTGRNEIRSILLGNGNPNIPQGYGFLKASVPVDSVGNYTAQVVCFSESPTFALDFFRYRSFRRWNEDQRFGIGFDKSHLVALGVRPVVYPDQNIMRDILFLFDFIKKPGSHISVNDEINHTVIQLINAIYPLLFPLLETEELQGFMWEREWRFPNSTGFSFEHQLIKIICCPDEEEGELRAILGETAENISFIRTWEEYDEITDYLRSQQNNFVPYDELIKKATSYDAAIRNLNELAQKYSIAINSLDSYDSFITQLNTETQRLLDEKARLNEVLNTIQNKVKELENEKSNNPDKFLDKN